MRTTRPCADKNGGFILSINAPNESVTSYPKGCGRKAVVVGGFTFIILSIFLIPIICRAETLTASWYSRESCLREGTSGICANGEKLNDEKLTCASWDYDYGTLLLVTNVSNGKRVFVVVNDRGPSKRLYRMGRVIDLSKRAFSELAPLKQGIIPVTIERAR